MKYALAFLTLFAVTSVASATCYRGCPRFNDIPRTEPYNPDTAPRFQFPDEQEPRKEVVPQVSPTATDTTGGLNLRLIAVLVAAVAGLGVGVAGQRAKQAEDDEAGLDPDTGDEAIDPDEVDPDGIEHEITLEAEVQK